jgi:hypothetical protein
MLNSRDSMMSALYGNDVAVQYARTHGTSCSYQSYGGAPLKLQTSQEGAAPDLRAAFLLSQRAAVMP